MLGSAVEADDVVQDTWIRWQRADRSEVRRPDAFLATTTTRLAINVARSAHARHETHAAPWLPEPVATRADPVLRAEQGEAVGLGVLALLEKLPPTERAAHVLRTPFDYSFRDIAEVIAVREANARQLVTRARRHLASDRCKPVSASEHRRLLEAFVAAAEAGDLAGLERVLAADVAAGPDGLADLAA